MSKKNKSKKIETINPEIQAEPTPEVVSEPTPEVAAVVATEAPEMVIPDSSIEDLPPVETEVMSPTDMNLFGAAIEELTRFFRFANNKLAGGTIKMPIVAILPAGRRKMIGWHRTNTWKVQGQEEDRTEVVIAAEALSGPKDLIYGTIIHLMAHLTNSQKGIADHNAIGYHNKAFKTAAEQLGLLVEKEPLKGFSKTSMGIKAQECLNEFRTTPEHNASAFDIERKHIVNNYTRQFYCCVSEEDKAWLKATRGDTSEKDFFAKLKAAYLLVNPPAETKEVAVPDPNAIGAAV